MGRILYVVQSFSRSVAGGLAWDAPAYSRDRGFAAALACGLARRKAGVLTVGAALDDAGRLADEAEIVGGFGLLPTAIILRSAFAFPPTGDLAGDEACPDERHHAAIRRRA
jgi:hypothetical protein